MKIRIGCIAASSVMLLLLTSYASAASWYGKQVASLQSIGGSDCIFFTLGGVPEADPARPNDPWLAFPRSQSGAKDLYAMLLAAKLSGSEVNVQTAGTTSSSCAGYVTVVAVWMP